MAIRHHLPRQIIWIALVTCYHSASLASTEDAFLNAAPAFSTIHSGQLRNSLWWHTAAHYHLDPYILYAVALVESSHDKGKHQISPWPWTLHHQGHAIHAINRHAASSLLMKQLAEGHHNIDIGLMQINWHWHRHRVSHPEQLLDPTTNLAIGAHLLSEAMASSPGNTALGIGRYHHWQNPERSLHYGNRILRVAEQLRKVL
jgi:Transglycosylase SLT domain